MDLTSISTGDLIGIGTTQARGGRIEDALLHELGTRYNYPLSPSEDKVAIMEFDKNVVIPLRGWTGLPPGIIRVRGSKPQPIPSYYKNLEDQRVRETSVALPPSKPNGSTSSTATEQTGRSKKIIRVFISYSHKDAELLTQLHEHLSALRRQGLIEQWTDREIDPGAIIEEQIRAHLEQADIYLLLVSSAFLQSDYCFQKEFQRACERQQAGKAIIVPIIVRDCDWKIPALQRFKALPEDGKPVISRHWHNTDEAFSNVARGLRILLESKKKYRVAKGNFTPDERHVSEQQRVELNDLCKQIVDRLIARSAALPDEELKEIWGRHFGIVWSQFAKEFNLEHGLQSLPREDFADAKSWMLQYRASKDKNFRRNNPQQYRDTLTKTIYTLVGKMGWSKEQLYAFASEKLACPKPVSTLNSLGNKQLELVRDRIRYEHTKLKVKGGKPGVVDQGNRNAP